MRLIKFIQGKLGVILILFLSVLFFGFATHEHNQITCKQIVIHILNDAEITFIDESDVRSIIQEGDVFKSDTKLPDINMAMLEKKIEQNPYVANAEVFSTVDGKLYAEVIQRRPLVRIINQYGEHFYIDTEGNFVPVSDKSAYSVIVANGFIFHSLKERFAVKELVLHGKQSKSLAYQLFELATFIDAHEFWNNQLEQIFVNSQQQIELIPRIGSQKIILGNTENMEKRFEKLLVFYNEAMPKVGWDSYSSINLMYDGQIVCTKK